MRNNFARFFCSQSGFTLIEVLGYIAILILMMNLISSVFMNSSKINKTGNKYIQSLRDVAMIESTIKKDLYETVQIIPRLNEYQTSDTTIILKVFKTQYLADGYRYIIYEKDTETNRLRKITMDGQNESIRIFNPEFKDIKFTYDHKEISFTKLVNVHMVLNKPGNRQIGETAFNFLVKLRMWQSD